MAEHPLNLRICKAKRLRMRHLDVIQGTRYSEVLHMTIDEALAIPKANPNHSTNLQPLFKKSSRVYRPWVQSSKYLIRVGKRRRVKLASFLERRYKIWRSYPVLSSTNLRRRLHFHDIKKAAPSINAWSDQGHSVIIIEHILSDQNPQDLGDWLWDPKREIEVESDLCRELPRTWPKEPENFTGKYLRESFRGDFEQPSKGFSNPWRVIIIPIGASLRNLCYPFSNLWGL